MTRPPSPVRQFLDDFRPLLAGAPPDSIFAERMRSDTLTPEQILRAYETYHGMASTGDPAALFVALDALVKGTAPYFDGAPAALREAEKLWAKERARIAVMPVPEEARDGLNKNITSEWTRKHYGEARIGARWHDAAGRWLYSSVTYEREGEYRDVCYFYAQDGYWHEGVPLSKDRPLYRLPEILASSLPVIVVLGGRAASIEVPGYVVTTFSGGSSTASDWSPLAERAVTIWPSGLRDMNAAGAIKKRLPHTRVLDTERAPWDVPAAELAEFVATCPVLETAGDKGGRLPFSFLGFDSGAYHFLPRNRRVPYSIPMGRFTASQLLELAQLQWWAVEGMCNDRGSIRVDAAQDWVVSKQEDVGRVDLRRLRGAGVWRDGPDIVVNDGEAIVTMGGERLQYDAFTSADGAEYIPSDTHFGDMTGEESTDVEGAALVALFSTQSFARALDPVAALGWGLIAPFGGLLPWRPHIWLTGRRGTGKSTQLVEKLIDPLIGAFAYKGTGRTSEPALRRAGHLTARPYRLDEFDAKGKGDRERLARITELIRNSSCDSTAVTTLAGKGEGDTVTFIVRSCFALVSVNVLDLEAAIESRFVRIEKLPVEDIDKEMDRMARECPRVMADPARFRRRIFRALPRILSDIETVKRLLLGTVKDPRECDVIAPLIAAAWAVQSGQSIDCPEGHDLVGTLMDDVIRVHAERVEDEERVIQHILSSQVRTDEQRTRTVAELLQSADQGDVAAGELLSRHGLKLTTLENGDGKLHQVLAVAIHADPVAQMLRDTPYAAGYEAQLARHDLYRGTKAVRLAIGVKQGRCLEWAEFRARYLADGQGRLEGVDG